MISNLVPRRLRRGLWVQEAWPSCSGYSTVILTLHERQPQLASDNPSWRPALSGKVRQGPAMSGVRRVRRCPADSAARLYKRTPVHYFSLSILQPSQYYKYFYAFVINNLRQTFVVFLQQDFLYIKFNLRSARRILKNLLALYHRKLYEVPSGSSTSVSQPKQGPQHVARMFIF